jgi:hypothetical protein
MFLELLPNPIVIVDNKECISRGWKNKRLNREEGARCDSCLDLMGSMSHRIAGAA